MAKYRAYTFFKICFMAILAICSAQLTEHQVRLRHQAIQEASDLVLGSQIASVPGPGINQAFDAAVARIEALRNKQAAVQRWKGLPSPDFPPDFGVETQSQSRKLLQQRSLHASRFEAKYGLSKSAFRSACRAVAHTNIVGRNLYKGHLANVTTWPECCAACQARRGCVAWSLRVDGNIHQKGCFLKRGPYRVIKNVRSAAYGVNPGPLVSASSPVPSPAPVPSPSPSPVPSPTSSPLEASPTPSQRISLPVFSWNGAPQESSPPPPSPSPAPYPQASPLPSGKEKYAKVLGLTWLFTEAQRSGPTPSWNQVPWRWDSHMNDTVVGGWYDAGDTLKLSFPLAPTVSLYAWSLLEFKTGYETAGYIDKAINNVMLAADYLLRCHDVKNKQYIAQIGDPSIDHAYWGRPEQENNYRPALVYTPDMKAADLYGAVSAALASSSIAFRSVNSTWADLALASAIELYQWGVQSPGKYSDYYRKQTHSIYPSSNYHDRMAWAAGWLYRATLNTKYLDDALAYFTAVSPDVYPGWDSLFAPHAVHMFSLVQMGTQVKGANVYQQYIDQQFRRAWLVADGYLEVVRTPLGLVYPKWNEWANLQFSTTVSAILAVHAKYTSDPLAKAADISFMETQLNYVMGGVFRSFVVGYGDNSPLQPAHAAASCPDMPAPCGWANYPPRLGPNPQVIYGALVGGPMGVRKNATYPDFAYNDLRSDYISNEVANDYNVGLAFSLAALYEMLPW